MSTNNDFSEREDAVKTMCFYLSELQQKLDKQESDISAERHRLQVQGAWEPILHETTFFPGQLAFCKKAVVGLAARRIF